MNQTHGEFKLEVYFNRKPENSGKIYLKSGFIENHHMYQVAHLFDVEVDEDFIGFHYEFKTKEQLDSVSQFYKKNHERLFKELSQGELAIERIQDELDKNIEKWVKETESELYE
jgi:hypothetical protein